MATHCPTCNHVLGGGSISERLLALMVEEGRPLMPAEIAHRLRVQRTSVYQTLRRLSDRGSVRRGVIQGESGYIISPQGGTPPAAGLSASDLDEGREMLSQALRDLVSYVASARVVGRQSAVEFLGKLGCDELTAQDIIGLAIQGELLGADEGNLVAP